MPHIFSYDLAELKDTMTLLGDKPFRAEQVWRWLYHQDELCFQSMANVPLALRKKLDDNFTSEMPTVHDEHISQCGTIKWLFKFDGKNAVETVFIPEKNRGTLCISSQIGCALACQFCATGLVGFYRNLTTAEIITQVWFARSELKKRFPDAPRISNIVFMGMGEPLLNEQNVFRAVRILLHDLAFGLAKKRVTISTSGIVPALKRLTTDSEAALAVSLHAPFDHIRDSIVPINQRYNLKALLDACEEYTQHTKKPITYEYVMLKDINDTRECAQGMVKLLKGKNIKVNLIPYNPVEGLKFVCSDAENIEQFQKHLLANNIRTTVRKTRGDEINAACGQLYGQVMTRKKTIRENQFKEKVS